MPIADRSTPGLPEGTRFVQATIDAPRDAIKASRGRTRALMYANNAIDRATQMWFKEFKDYPDWECMEIRVSFTTFHVIAEVSDKFAHGPK